MGFPFSSKGVNLDGPPPAPAKVYTLEIVEATDTDKDGNPLVTKKNSDPMVKCKIKIHDEENNWTPFFHWVVFIPKGKPGEGMAINFLKHIGEPWEDDFIVEPENWVGKKFRAMVKVEKDDQGTLRNGIRYLVDESTEATKEDSEVPF